MFGHVARHNPEPKGELNTATLSFFPPSSWSSSNNFLQVSRAKQEPWEVNVFDLNFEWVQPFLGNQSIFCVTLNKSPLGDLTVMGSLWVKMWEGTFIRYLRCVWFPSQVEGCAGSRGRPVSSRPWLREGQISYSCLKTYIKNKWTERLATSTVRNTIYNCSYFYFRNTGFTCMAAFH